MAYQKKGYRWKRDEQRQGLARASQGFRGAYVELEDGTFVRVEQNKLNPYVEESTQTTYGFSWYARTLTDTFSNRRNLTYLTFGAAKSDAEKWISKYLKTLETK